MINFFKKLFNKKRNFWNVFWELGVLTNVIFGIILLVFIVLVESKNQFIGYLAVAFIYFWLVLYLPFLLIISLKTKASTVFQTIIKIFSIVGIIIGILIGLFWVYVAFYGWI